MADLIYLDLQAKNLQNVGQETSQLVLEDNRDQEIIKNAADYKLSVVRFVCDTNLLPVFTCGILDGSVDPDESIYKITLEYDGAVITQTLIWKPELKTASIPPAPSTLPNGLQLSRTNYYNCLNYQHFINLINETFDTAMTLLIFEKPGPLTGIAPPHLAWNTSTLSAELIADPIFESRATVAGGNAKIYFNNSLYSLFSSLASEQVFLSSSRDYQIMIASNLGYNLLGTDLILKQNYSTISNWSPISSIVFASQNLPVSPGLVSSPLISKNGLVIPASGSSNSTINIISDISVNQQSFKPNLIYTPSAEYRFIDILASSPISNVSISVFYKTTNGEFFPFPLSSGSQGSMKLLFQKK